jgi:hypothetical protein
MKLSDLTRINELTTKYETFEETKQAVENEFPTVKVIYNADTKKLSLIEEDLS